MPINFSTLDLFESPVELPIVVPIDQELSLCTGLAHQARLKYINVFELLDQNLELTDVGYFSSPDNSRIVICLVIKQKYWHISNQSTILNSLLKLRDFCILLDIYEIAFPKSFLTGPENITWESLFSILDQIFTFSPVFLHIYN